MDTKIDRKYDILELFSAISTHEVFTPPSVVEKVLDFLPEDVWTRPDYRFLDPATKSGVFLREIFLRLMKGLEGKGKFVAQDGMVYDLDDPQARANHILKNMVFGIATSEVTAWFSRRTLYGVREACADKFTKALEVYEKSRNKGALHPSEIEINRYFDPRIFRSASHVGFECQGNIFYPNVTHETKDEGISVAEETLFPFIHEGFEHEKIQEIKEGKMKFDVIVGNPPYQIKDGGYGASAKPIYHEFVEMAKKLNPRYITMIIPARWYAGGKGLDEFRKTMLADKRIEVIVDFIDSTDCFPSVEVKGGICYFLWNSTHKGTCRFVSMQNNNKVNESNIDLSKFDILIRHPQTLSILEKVMKKNEPTMESQISPRKPFGLATNFSNFSEKPVRNYYKIYARNKIGYVDPSFIKTNTGWIKKHKVLVSKAYGAGNSLPHQIIGVPQYAEPNSVCTETYLVCGVYDTEEEARNFIAYMKTKFFRFLVFLRKNTQDLKSDRFKFVPQLDMKELWTDEKLYARYGLTEEEIAYIESVIKPME